MYKLHKEKLYMSYVGCTHMVISLLQCLPRCQQVNGKRTQMGPPYRPKGRNEKQNVYVQFALCRLNLLIVNFMHYTTGFEKALI